MCVPFVFRIVMIKAGLISIICLQIVFNVDLDEIHFV